MPSSLPQYNLASLGVVRVTVFGLLGFWLVRSDPASLVDLDSAWFTRRGIWKILPGSWLLLDPFWLQVVKWMSLCCAVLAGLGVSFYRIVSAMCILGVFYLDAVGKGFGCYVNHADFVLIFCGLILVFSPAGRSLALCNSWKLRQSQDGEDTRAVVAMVLMAWILLSSYSMIGIHRIAMGGIQTFFEDGILIHLGVQGLSYGPYGFRWATVVLEQPALWPFFKFGYFAVTVLECTALICLFSRGFRFCWVAAMLGFHLATLPLMNIFFINHFVLIVVLLTGLPSLIASGIRKDDRKNS